MIDVDKIDDLIKKAIKVQDKLKYNKVASDRRNILSIDGGGSRVLIAMIILMALEEKTKRSVTSMFTNFGGTSTGAFLISALNKPKGMTEDKLGYPKHSAYEVFKFFKDNV